MNRKNLYSLIAASDRRGQPDLWIQSAKIDGRDFCTATFRVETNELGIISGSAIDLVETVAIDRAIFELIERISIRKSFNQLSELTAFKPLSIFRRFLPRTERLRDEDASFIFSDTTSGCAIHSNPLVSLENALKELIERHTILTAQLQGVPGEMVYGPGKFTRDSINGVMRVFLWSGPLSHYVAMAEISHENGLNRLFGFGASKDKNAAIHKAKTEGVLISSNLRRDVLDNANGRIFDIMRWHYGQVKDERFYDASKITGKIPRVDSEIKLSEFYYIRRFIEPGFWLSRVISPSVQILHTGLWDEKRVNPRFRRFVLSEMERPYVY